MLWVRHNKITIETNRCVLRLPKMIDYTQWVDRRRSSETFLKPWEPEWIKEWDSEKNFKHRVKWAKDLYERQQALILLVFRKHDGLLLGGVTLDSIQRGPRQSASIGYWVSENYARQGYMSEVVQAVVAYVFAKFDISRVEACTLPENIASCGLLEKCGFKYEGVAQSYLQIAGRWRTHKLYANIRVDRRGRTSAGIYSE